MQLAHEQSIFTEFFGFLLNSITGALDFIN